MADSELAQYSHYSEDGKMLTWTIDVHMDGWKAIADALEAKRRSSGSSTSTLKPTVTMHAPADHLRPLPAHIERELTAYRRNRLRIYVASAAWTLTATLYATVEGRRARSATDLVDFGADADDDLLRECGFPTEFLAMVRGLGQLIEESATDELGLRPLARAFPYDGIEIEFARFLLDPAFEAFGDYAEYKDLVAIVYGRTVEQLAAEVNPSEVLELAGATEVVLEE